MENHLTENQILEYVFKRLSQDQKEEVNNHISSCDSCEYKILLTYDKVIKKCIEIKKLFNGYYTGRLDDVRMKVVKEHLMVCDNCLYKYNGFVKKKIEGLNFLQLPTIGWRKKGGEKGG